MHSVTLSTKLSPRIIVLLPALALCRQQSDPHLATISSSVVLKIQQSSETALRIT